MKIAGLKIRKTDQFWANCWWNKKNKNFITDLVDENDFFNYVDYIDDCKVSFEKESLLFQSMSSLSEKVSEIKKQKEASQLTPSHGSKPIRFSWEKKKNLSQFVSEPEV